MKTIQFVIATSLLLVTTATWSQEREGEFFVGPELGRGNFSISSPYTVTGEKESFSGVSVGVEFGYHWSNNIIVDGNISRLTRANLFGAFDRYKLTQVQALAGYSLEVSEHFRIVPMAGVSRWSLDTKEGQLFNPGREMGRKFEGTDWVYKINMEIPLGNLVLLYYTHSRSKFDFGKIELNQLGVKFEF